MRKMGKCITYLILLILTNIAADQRSYVWTYEYIIQEPGIVEIENYVTTSAPSYGKREGNSSTELQLEWEIGMSEQFDIAVYQRFSQTPDKSLMYNGFKIRSRIKIGYKGKYPVDPLLYFEYQGNPDLTTSKWEGKIIIAKDWGNVNLAANPIFELEKEDTWELVTKYAIGARYEINRLIRVGIEMKGSKSQLYIGPVISHGTEKAWVTLGSAFAQKSKTDDTAGFQVRLLLGFRL